MKKLTILTLTLALFCFSASPLFAQEQSAQQQPSAEELDKQKAEREKNAYRLLDQIIDEAQSLRLPENRVRIQVNAADLLWDQNQGRARSLFASAAEGVAEIRCEFCGQQYHFDADQIAGLFQPHGIEIQAPDRLQ